MTDQSVAARRQLVFIGGGPKALFALEALAARLDSAEHMHITVIDPAERLGSGSAYAPDQPAVNRLNVDATILDAAEDDIAPSFSTWAHKNRPDIAQDPYPPRAVVGAYLRTRWSRCRQRWESIGGFEHHQGTAIAARPLHTGWSVRVHTPGLTHTVELDCDELIIATGHARKHPGALETAWTGSERLVPAVHPVATMLDPASVPPGSRVAVRGAALTFLDAALALTEGRGGRFDRDPRSADLVHHRSPGEPETILPTARHSLLLHPKPAPRTALPQQVAIAIAEGRRRLVAPMPIPHVLNIVEETAAALLRPTESARDEIAFTLESGSEPEAADAEQSLRCAIDVAAGDREAGPAWALGRAWSGLYPQVTRTLRGCEASLSEWWRFCRAAQVLERFAFGPPLETARALLAMVRSGAVDLSWLDAGTQISHDGITGIPAGSTPADVVLDAVLAPPGVRNIDEPLFQQLLADGYLHVRPGRRGAIIDSDGTAQDAEGRRVEGLVLFGRPTEDHVIGHDTLNRHLHDEIDQWAQRLTEKASEHA